MIFMFCQADPGSPPRSPGSWQPARPIRPATSRRWRPRSHARRPGSGSRSCAATRAGRAAPGRRPGFGAVRRRAARRAPVPRRAPPGRRPGPARQPRDHGRGRRLALRPSRRADRDRRGADRAGHDQGAGARLAPRRRTGPARDARAGAGQLGPGRARGGGPAPGGAPPSRHSRQSSFAEAHRAGESLAAADLPRGVAMLEALVAGYLSARPNRSSSSRSCRSSAAAS